MFRVLSLLILGLSLPAIAGAAESPMLNMLQSKGSSLNFETVEWMKKWQTTDLEDTHTYKLAEISGSTSVNIKVHKIDSTDPKGYKSRGTFVPRNAAGNPNTEIAYFHLAALFGVDHLFRPALRYELGKNATESLRNLLVSTPINHPAKRENKLRILAEINKGSVIKGCLKAKKPDSARALEEINSASANHSHKVIKMIQAYNPQPKQGNSLQLLKGYVGDELELAREYSILMTFDAVFGQWDRHSGGNVTIRLDPSNRAHFYSTDNGGATLSSGTKAVEKTLAGVSRFDRTTIKNLIELYKFLEAPHRGYFGYTDSQSFVVDLGLYFEISPATYSKRLKRNIGLVLARVKALEAKYGNATYFQ